MPQIHPTAIIDDQAELADDVVVGPQCVIQGRVRLGPGCRLLHRVSLQGPLVAGANNVFYPNTCVGFAAQHLKFDHDRDGAGVSMGDGNILREGVNIHRATQDQPTSMGNENYLMVNAHMGHDVHIGSQCMLANAVLLAGHVELGDSVIFGGGAAMHQFCRVGRLAMVAGIRASNRDVPPFCVVYNTRRVGSLNIIGLRRAGYRKHIDNLRNAFNLFYRRGHTNRVGADLIEQQFGDDPLCREFVQFIRESKRGITPYGNSRDITDEEDSSDDT